MSPSGPTLHIFVIHTQALTLRAMHIHGVIQQLRTAAMARGFEVRPVLILTSDPAEISNNIADYQSKVTYDPVGDEDFDNLRQMLSVEVISNLEKHKEAWRRIYDTDSSNKEDMFLVLEDDAVILPDGIQGFGDVLQAAKTAPWDLMFLGISMHSEKENEQVAFSPAREAFGKVVPAKESYLITQQTARKFFDMLSKYRFSTRVHISHMLHTEKNLRVVLSNRRVLLDGSKVGAFPSSLHPNNLLAFNREYMDLLQYISKDPSTVEKDLPAIRALFKRVQHMNSPDIMHLYGALLFKAGKVLDAEEVLTNAVKQMHAAQGILNSRSDLMNNLIMVYRHMQRDLPEYLKALSTYDDPKAAEADI